MINLSSKHVPEKNNINEKKTVDFQAIPSNTYMLYHLNITVDFLAIQKCRKPSQGTVDDLARRQRISVPCRHRHLDHKREVRPRVLRGNPRKPHRERKGQRSRPLRGKRQPDPRLLPRAELSACRAHVQRGRHRVRANQRVRGVWAKIVSSFVVGDAFRSRSCSFQEGIV